MGKKEKRERRPKQKVNCKSEAANLRQGLSVWQGARSQSESFALDANSASRTLHGRCLRLVSDIDDYYHSNQNRRAAALTGAVVVLTVSSTTSGKIGKSDQMFAAASLIASSA